MGEKIFTLSVCGPTASGKTALSIELARRLDGEIVSCDSMQLYKYMDIGTAKPTPYEQSLAPHHMISVADPSVTFSAADYSSMAQDIISDIHSRGKLPIICGGTGLYLDSLMKITSYSVCSSDEKTRAELESFAAENGAEALHARLASVDPEAAQSIHFNNVKRVVRALEIYLITGKTKTETDREQVSGENRYDNVNIILDFLDRELLCSRINRRVDMMIEQGLVDETRRLLDMGVLDTKTASQAIGYKELIPYLRNECTLSDAVEMIKLRTRQYSKRQATWFRRYDGIIIHPDENYASTGRLLSVEEMCGRVLSDEHLHNRLKIK